MECSNCGKKFDRALELFNGDLRCPKCRKTVVPENFDINETTDAWFNLSEVYFFTYLEHVSQNNGSSSGSEQSKFNKKAIFLMNKAVEYCKMAAIAGHPDAIVKLGFYYGKNYIDYGAGGFGRYKAAYRYFERIIDVHDEPLKEVYKAYYTKSGKSEHDAIAMAEKSTKAVKEKAALYLFDMINSAPDEFVNTVVDKDKKYSYDYNKQKIVDDKKILGEDKIQVNRKKNPIDKVEHIQKILSLCDSKRITNSPLFGFFVVTASNLKTLFSYYSELQYKEKILFAFVPVEVNSDGSERLANNTFATDKIEDFADREPNKNACIYIFNSTNASTFTKKGRLIRSFQKKLSKNKDDLLKHIIMLDVDPTDKRIEEHVFYIDDALLIKKSRQKDIKKAFELHIKGELE